MKVKAIRNKRSIAVGETRYAKGDEEALDKALSESEKKRYAELGLIELERVSKKKDAKVQRDD